MGDVSDFLVCSFCGRTSSSEDVNFIIRSSLSKQACVCDRCVRGLTVLVANCYNGMMEDENNYSLD